MRKRTLVVLPTLALACTLTACGGGTDDSGASPEEYANLVDLLDENTPDGQVASAEEYNEQADFPDGVSLAEFDNESTTLCVQDTGAEAAVRIVLDGPGGKVELLDSGLCSDGKVVSTLTGDLEETDTELEISGDEERGEAVREAFTEIGD